MIVLQGFSVHSWLGWNLYWLCQHIFNLIKAQSPENFMRVCFCEISRYKPSFADPKQIHHSGNKIVYQFWETAVDMTSSHLFGGWRRGWWLLILSLLGEKTFQSITGCPFKIYNSTEFLEPLQNNTWQHYKNIESCQDWSKLGSIVNSFISVFVTMEFYPKTQQGFAEIVK